MSSSTEADQDKNVKHVYYIDRREVSVISTRSVDEAGGDYGIRHEHDPHFNGPVPHRSCTDIFFLLLLIAAILAWLWMCLTATHHGDVRKVLFPVDSLGNICGFGSMADKPNLFFFDVRKCSPQFEEDEWIPTTRCRTPQICVKTCPTKTILSADIGITSEEDKQHLRCQYDADMSLPVKELVESGLCASYYLASEPVVNYCVPKSDEVEKVEAASTASLIRTAQEKMSMILNARYIVEKLLSDIKQTWYDIICILGYSVGICLIWILLMQCFSGVMVWIGLIALKCLLIYGTYYSWSVFIDLKGVKSAEGSVFRFSRKISFYTQRRQTWLLLGCICTFLLSILMVVFCALRPKISLSVSLLQEASKCISRIPTTLILPFFLYAAQIIIAIVSTVFLLCLASLTPSATGGIDSSTYSDGLESHIYERCIQDMKGSSVFSRKACTITTGAMNDYIEYLHVYNFFMCMWLFNAVVGFGQMVHAGAVSSFYWSKNKYSTILPFCSLVTNMLRVMRFHLGTIALGSLIVAILRLVRLIMEYIQSKMDEDSYKNLINACRCIGFFIDRMLRYVNKNVYIVTAIYGESYCEAAERSFNLIMRNLVKVVVVNHITEFLLLCSKLVVVAITGFLAHTRFSAATYELFYPYSPIIICCILSYFVATVFFDVYDMTVDTLFICYLDDFERNDGSKERPYYMPGELRVILRKSRRPNP